LASFEIVERCECVGDIVVLKARLHTERALADGGHANFWRENFADAIAPPEAIQSSFSEEDRVVFAAFDLPQTSVYVAPQFAHIKIGAYVTNLRLAAKAASTNARALAKSREHFIFCGDQAIAGVFPPADNRKTEARWNFGGNVFNAVDGKIDFFIEQSFFQFLDKDAFPADLREWRRLQFVASGFDDDDFGVDSGDFENLLANELGLPFGEHAAARTNTNGFHR
jgi:hypothetical protein